MSQDYSAKNFYVNGTDKRGHDKQIRCHFPQDVVGELSAIVACKDFPYKTFGDLVRDAVVHRLHQLEDISNDPVALQSLALYQQAEKRAASALRVAAERSLVASTREAIYSPELRRYLTKDDFEDTIASISDPALRRELAALRPSFDSDGNIV